MSGYTQFAEATVTAVTPQIVQANALAASILNADNADAVVEDFVTSGDTDDEAILAFQNFLASAHAKIAAETEKAKAHAVATNLISAVPLSEDEKKAKREEYDVLKTLVSSMLKAAGKAADNMPEDAAKEIREILAKAPMVTKLPVTRSSGGTGQTGIKRPRFSAIRYRTVGAEDWTDICDDKGKSTLTLLSATWNADEANKEAKRTLASDIAPHIFALAETDDLSKVAGKTFDFVYSIESGGTYEVQATVLSA